MYCLEGSQTSQVNSYNLAMGINKFLLTLLNHNVYTLFHRSTQVDIFKNSRHEWLGKIWEEFRKIWETFKDFKEFQYFHENLTIFSLQRGNLLEN